MMAQPSHEFSTLARPVTAIGPNCTPPTGPYIPLNTMSNLTASIMPPVDEAMKRNAAWKYEGYQAFSKWMASDDDFFVIRRFESLNANTLLWMQDKISRLEKELQELHQSVENAKISENMMNWSFRWDEKNMKRRDDIMDELSRRLHDYSEFRTPTYHGMYTYPCRSVHRCLWENSCQIASRGAPGQ
jgi:hypothetical protein